MGKKGVMRKIAYALVVAGITLGILLPAFHLHFSGSFIQDEIVYDRANGGWRAATLYLSPADNPVRLQFVAEFLVGGRLPPVKIPLDVKISDADGTLMAAIVSLPASGRDAGAELPKIRSTTAPVFSVQQEGQHTLEVAFAPNKNNGNILLPDVKSLTAEFTANATEPNEDYKLPAVVLVILGIYLLIRSGREGRKVRAPVKWGRGKK